MEKPINNFIQGVMQVLVLDPGGDYIIPSKGDFRQDVRTLSKDSKRVSQDLYTTTISGHLKKPVSLAFRGALRGLSIGVGG